jgi:hypothetical protein
LAVRKMFPLLCFQLVALFFCYLSWQNKHRTYLWKQQSKLSSFRTTKDVCLVLEAT